MTVRLALAGALALACVTVTHAFAESLETVCRTPDCGLGASIQPVCRTADCGRGNLVLTFDNGQYQNVDPATRQWFKSLRNSKGYLCCSIADGHQTTWRGTRAGGYEAMIDGTWITIPDDTVIHGAGNPTGEGVVFYGMKWETPELKKYEIRCFVPGAEG